MTAATRNYIKCYHCGDNCIETYRSDVHTFCCIGCQTVYDILNNHNLCDYYQIDSGRGTSMQNKTSEDFAYLDGPEVRSQLLSFDSPNLSRISFTIPAIHCISCVWLLEKLETLDAGIIHAEVTFIQKSVTISFDPGKTTLARIASVLSSLGYTPNISLQGRAPAATQNRTLILKLALAGFGFANIMLFSFPEYLGIDQSDHHLMRIFNWLNLAIAIPVLAYSASDYMLQAVRSFKHRQINIELPIAIGLVALFCRSAFDIITDAGPGYLDSFAGLVFFLLVGRWFQGKTYDALAFDRDYTSYFPLAVHRWQKNMWTPALLHNLTPGDRVRIRNMEIIPADALLESDEAFIDYSFVSGESKPEKIARGATIYAGGRLIGAPIELTLKKSTSQSKLTSLWNNQSFEKQGAGNFQRIMDRTARIFTWIVMALALATAAYWYFHKPTEMWLVLTCVLMVACPCALALATPFTLGSMLRVLGHHELYLKNAEVIERIGSIDAIVFDKTGTITNGEEVTYVGDEKLLGEIRKLCGYSTHPLSVQIHRSIDVRSDAYISDFQETPGLGIEGIIDGAILRIGSSAFNHIHTEHQGTERRVYASLDNEYLGYFSMKTHPRSDIKKLLYQLDRKCFALVSGDSDMDAARMSSLFPAHTRFLFNQSPQDKTAFIRHLQADGKKVMMIGDGLNDAGALKQADVGIAVSDNKGIFSPACDGIISGNQLMYFDRMLKFAGRSTAILKAAFVVSFCYNAVALSFAVTGNLTPLIAAIIMPISSISVVAFSTYAVQYSAKKLKLSS